MLVIHPDDVSISGFASQMSARCDEAGHRTGPREVAEHQYGIAKLWPNITLKKEPPADAKEWEGVDEEQYSDQIRRRHLIKAGTRIR